VLQAGRLRVQFLMVSLDFFIFLIVLTALDPEVDLAFSKVWLFCTVFYKTHNCSLALCGRETRPVSNVWSVADLISCS